MDPKVFLAALGLPEGTTPEQLTDFCVQAKKNEKAIAELDAVRAELTANTAKVVALETDLSDAKTKLTAEAKRADENEGELIRLEVESFVGKRITPAEVEVAIADRKRDGKADFAKRMAARADLKLLENNTPTSGPASALSTGNPGARFAATVSKESK